MTTETLTLVEMQTRLAGGKVLAKGYVDEWGVETITSDSSEWPRVYFFPESVRVPCPRLKADLAPCPEGCELKHQSIEGLHLHPGPGHHVTPCTRCDSRGWTPAVDGFIWMDAVKDLPGWGFKNFVEWWFAEMAKDWTQPCQPSFFAALDVIVSRMEGIEF